MTHDETLIRAALMMRDDILTLLIATGIAGDAPDDPLSNVIRAIDVDEVLARLSPAPDAVARLVEAARAGLNYLENTEGEFGITLESATGLRAALAAMEASHDRT